MATEVMATDGTMHANADAALVTPSADTTPPITEAKAETDVTTPATPSADEAPKDAPPAEPPKTPEPPKVPDKYEWKVQDGTAVDPAFRARTEAKARSLGLDNEAGQKLFDAELADDAARLTAQKEEYDKILKSWEPGGENYKRRTEEWQAEAKKDPRIVGNTPTNDAFVAAAQKAERVLKAFGGGKLEGVLKETGYAFHPDVIAFLVDIGNRMSESTLALGNVANAPARQPGVLTYENNGEGPKRVVEAA